MKNYLFLCFITILFCGCLHEDNTNTEYHEEALHVYEEQDETNLNVELSSPIINLRSLYKGVQEFVLEEVIIYDSNLSLILDGIEYVDDTLVLDIGNHVLKAYDWDEFSKSQEVVISIKILDENNNDYADVYQTPNSDSNIITTADINSLHIVEDYSYYNFEFVENEIICWEEVQLSDNNRGFIIKNFELVSNNSTYDHAISLQLENDKQLVFDEALDDCAYTISNILSEYGYFVIEVSNGSLEESCLIINSTTGEEIETMSKFIFSPDGDKFITANKIRVNFEQSSKHQILHITEGEIIIEWTGEFLDYGAEEITWLDDNNIQMTRVIPIDDIWYRVDRDYKEVSSNLVFENDNWTMIEQEEMTEDRQIPIYDAINKNGNVINSILESQIKEVIFTNVYQIINNKLVLWFEIEIDDTVKGYIYRSLKDFESPYYDNDSSVFSLLLDNNEYITIEGHIEYEGDFVIKDDLEGIGYFTTYSTFDGEGYDGGFYNSKNGDVYYAKDGEPILSNSNKRFIIANKDLLAGFQWNGIQIYRIDDNDIILEYEQELYEWGPTNVQWINDEHITFSKTYFDEINLTFIDVAAELILVDGSWIIIELEN